MDFSFSIFSIFLLLTVSVDVVDNLIAYDRRNELLNIPENEIRVITDAIDNYKPKLTVQFMGLQNVKRRKSASVKDGVVRIQANGRRQPKANIENVKVDQEIIQLRFGGGSKAHYPYNRVIDWHRSNSAAASEKSHEETTTTIKPSAPPVTPKHWATTTKTSWSLYSVEPALILPSRFHRKKEELVIVFKKKKES